MHKLHLIGLSLLLFSCDRNPEIDSGRLLPAAAVDYTRLQVGNYWIYEVYENDGKGNLTFYKGLDSTYVEKDTMIGGLVYKKFVEQYDTSKAVSYLRTVSHYLTNPLGDILFSSEDFKTIFATEYKTVNGKPGYSVTYQMSARDTLTSTPAGVFTTSDFRLKYTISPLAAKGSDTVKYAFVKYAKGAGMVFKTIGIYIDRNQTVEKRLLRYSLKK